jgi:chromosome partitioning protein
MSDQVRIYTRAPAPPPRRILVANSKGGCGKSTISSNIAAAYAAKGYATSLVDCDPQQTASFWLSRRPGTLPPIYGVVGVDQPSRPTLDWLVRIPRGTERIVIDSPGGIANFRLNDLIERVDVIIIPLLPSAIDIHATTEFIKEIYLSSSFRNSSRKLFVVGNRVDKRNKYFHQLNRFLRRLGIEEVMHIPDSYIFLRSIDEGMGVVDMPDASRYSTAKQAIEELVKKTEPDHE